MLLNNIKTEPFIDEYTKKYKFNNMHDFYLFLKMKRKKYHKTLIIPKHWKDILRQWKHGYFKTIIAILKI